MKHIGNDERNRIKFMLGYGKKNTLSSSQRKQTLSSPIPVLSLRPVYLHHLASHSALLHLFSLTVHLHYLSAHSLTLSDHSVHPHHLPSLSALLHHLPAPRQLPSQEINPSNLIRPFKIFPQRILISQNNQHLPQKLTHTKSHPPIRFSA